jgi:transcriptional regulator with XRE-family HTH domain
MVPVEIGQKVKEVFDSKQMKLTDFADSLGTVRQNVYRIFRKRHLDTGLLLKISQVLEHNFFQYYVDPHTAAQAAPPAATPADFEDQLALSRKEIDYLHKIIKLMEERSQLIQELEAKEMRLY